MDEHHPGGARERTIADIYADHARRGEHVVVLDGLHPNDPDAADIFAMRRSVR